MSLRENIWSDIQHWLGKLQSTIGPNTIVSISSSTRMQTLTIMVNWFDGENMICDPFISKFTIMQLSKYGQDSVTGSIVKYAREWKTNQGNKPKEIKSDVGD